MALANKYTLSGVGESSNLSHQQEAENMYEAAFSHQESELVYENVALQETTQTEQAEVPASFPVTNPMEPKAEVPSARKTTVFLSVLLAMSWVIGLTSMALIFLEKAQVQSELAVTAAHRTETDAVVTMLNSSIAEFKENMYQLKSSLAESDGRRSKTEAAIKTLISSIAENKKHALQLNSSFTEIITRMKEDENVSCDVKSLADAISDNRKTINLLRSFRGVKLNGSGATASQGRVDVYHDGVWGTICDDQWDLNDAHVICRMLGFKRATSAPGQARYGPGTGQIWLDEVECSGSEFGIDACPKWDWGKHDCGHGEDASVVCDEAFG